MNRALMAASLVDRVQVTLFPALTGQTGLAQIFEGAAEGSLHMRRWRHPHIVRSARRSPSGLHVAAHRPPGSARRRTATSATRLPPISGAALRASPKPGCRSRNVRRKPAGGLHCRRRQAAPDTRPARTPAATFPLVSAISRNGLRSRERRFESCRGHWSEA